MIPHIVTPRGWGWAVGSVLALTAGAILGWVELIALGVAGIVTFAVSTLFALVPHAHEVTFRLATPRVVVGEDAHIIVNLTNPTSRRLAALNIDIPVGQSVITRSVGRLRGKEQAELSLDIGTDARGVLRVGPVRIVRQDPLGLLAREVSHGAATILFVHPVTVGLASMSTGFMRDLEGNPTRDLTDSDLSFHALREYVAGDDRRNIHWKSTAKTGRFMVRQFEQTRRSHMLIALDTAPDDFADGQEFELAVSTAASLGVRALRDTRDLSVLHGVSPPKNGINPTRRGGASAKSPSTSSSTAILPTVSRARLLDSFAGVNLAAESPSLVTLGRIASGHSADVSVGFLITGSTPDAKAIHAASVTFPAGVEVVVIVCQTEVPPAVKLLGRLTVITIGRLDDITQILGRTKVKS